MTKKLIVHDKDKNIDNIVEDIIDKLFEENEEQKEKEPID